MANILEIIKSFLNKNKVKALPPGKKILNKIDFLSSSSHFAETELTKNIGNFLNSYEEKLRTVPIDGFQGTTYIPTAYDALVYMNSFQITQEQYTKNSFQESNLINSLKNNSIYSLQFQGNENNPHFYHVKSSNYQMPDFKNLIRIYLNCNSGNIAELAQAILSTNTSQNFYLKFVSALQESKIPRNEKITLYCSENDYNYYIQLLQYINQIRPDLFENSENKLAFLEKRDTFISVSRQPVSNIYTDLNNQAHQIPQATNSFIAKILEESYINSAKEIAISDPELSFLLNSENSDNRILFIKNYPYINSKYHSYLMKSMQAKMKILAEKNDTYIDGITNAMQPQKDYKREYEQFERFDNR